jgi:hypothetical protein
MTNFARTLAAALIASTTLGSAASAAVIDLTTLIGTWDVQDQFMNVGDFYANSYFAPTAITLKFTDLFVQGDSYSVHINGVFQYNTTFPALDGTFIADPDAAYASGKFSKGLISLAAGDVVEFDAHTIPDGFGDGTIAVTAYVPEPASWALMIAGFGMVGAAMRRRAVVTA